MQQAESTLARPFSARGFVGHTKGERPVLHFGVSFGYADFDDTFDSGELKLEGEAAGAKFIHHYAPHVKDWRPGDPTCKS